VIVIASFLVIASAAKQSMHAWIATAWWPRDDEKSLRLRDDESDRLECRRDR